MVGLYSAAEQEWPLLAARYYQIDLLELPVSRFLDLVTGWLREVLAPEKFENLMAQMEAPMPGQRAEISETVVEEEGMAFMAAMAMAQGVGH